MRKWFRGLQQLVSGRSLPRSFRSRPLALEVLEDRSLMSASVLQANVLQTNLVSDLPGVAQVQDPNLVNPWDISESGGSPFWISDNNAGVSTLYNAPNTSTPPFSVSLNPLVVSIPTPGDPTGASGTPTGTVFNTDGGAAGGFAVTNGTTTKAAIFLFATEDGTIVGWQPSVNPVGSDTTKAGTFGTLAVNNSGNNFTDPNPDTQTGAVYKGLAIATGTATLANSNGLLLPNDPNSHALLYASNFRAGTVDVFDAKFAQLHPSSTPTATSLPAGAFTDPNLPAGYAPFNVQELGSGTDARIYVTYAKQNAAKHDDVAGLGNGFVDVYNLDGSGLQRLISGGKGSPLDSPWGLAVAPSSFGALAGDLLVGNFGNGHINAFNPVNGTFLGALKDPDGEAIQIDGLWALHVGNGGAGGDPQAVYFTAGLFGETHGLFGDLKFAAPGTPEGAAEAQFVTGAADLVQIDLNAFLKDSASGASRATLRQDLTTLHTDALQLEQIEHQFAADARDDLGTPQHHHQHDADSLFTDMDEF